MTFIAYLDQQGLTDPQLRWYLDYCCRDDYGAGISTVSAWAGIHYFASRHGFHAPGVEFAERDSVLTWPEGNGWITQRLALPLGERLLTKRIVTRIEVMKHGVEADVFDSATRQTERLQAERCIVALPVFIAARVVANPPAMLQAVARQTRYAPWLVANIHLDKPLVDRPGAAPSWDNVLYGTAGLGYVNAKHQSLEPVPSATVLTYYRALGASGDQAEGRKQLLERPWRSWRDEVLTELSAAHPDLTAKTRRIDITRYGHAMAIPTPSNNDLKGQIRPQSAYLLPHKLSKTERNSSSTSAHQRLLFAHSDWAGYSVFEEAFAMGHAAGSTVGV